MKRGWSLRRRESVSERSAPERYAASEADMQGAQNQGSKKIPQEMLSAFVGDKFVYDFEAKYEDWKKEAESKRWEIPNDNVKVEIIPKVTRLAENPVPPELQNKKSRSVKPYIHDCIDFYTSDHVRVQRTHATEIPIQNISLQKRLEGILEKKQFCEVDGGEKPLTQSQQIFHDPNEIPKPEGVNKALVTNCSEGTSAIKSEQRIPLFHVYSGSQKYLPESPFDTLYPPYAEGEAIEFVAEPGDISFDLGNVEPYIGSLALYNFAKKKKISETFYFHCNERTQINMLTHDPSVLPDFAPAIFKISHMSQDVFFVLRIEKILQGDVDSVCEPYNRSDTIKSKDKDKYIQAASLAAARYSYWQPFCWACAPLFNEENQIPDAITFRPIYRTRDQDIPDINICTSTSEGKGSSKKMKSIPGRCTIRLKRIPKGDVIPGRISPSLVPVKPTSEVSYFREMQEFSSSPVLEPYTDYVNDLFLYIDSANLSARTGSPSAKDIAIEVKFKDTDEDITAPGLPVIYAPGRNELVTSAVTPVSYHNKNPSFYREFKIRLPAILHSAHHLVFTFYQVNVQASKTSKSSVASVPVAYAFWQIYPNERVVSKEVLPIFTEVPAFYLSEDITAKAIDNRKKLLSLRTKLNSTVYTQDLHMNNALKRMRQLPSNKMELALKPIPMLSKVHPVRIIKYFPVIINYILNLLCNYNEVSQAVFAAIPEILTGISNEANTNTLLLLRSYTDNNFRLFEKNDKDFYLYEVLTREWMAYIRDSKLDSEILLKYSSFLFKLIFKSMVLKIHDTGEIKDPSTRKARFSEKFYAYFKNLFAVLAWEICQKHKSALTVCKDLSRSMASFCNDLFAIADRGVIMQAVEAFMNETTAGESDIALNDFKFEFLRVLMEYEHFVSLNLPRPFTSRLPKASKLEAYFKKRHFLTTIIVEDIARYLQQEDKSLRIKAMDVMRRAFIGHEYDLSLAEDEAQTRAVSLYFPLLNVIVDHPITSDTVFEEQRDFLMCFLFLLKHTDKVIIQQWLKRESVGFIKRFFFVTYFCIRTFQFMDKEVWQERMMESSEVKSSAMTKATIENFYSAGGVPKRTTYRQRAQAKAEAEASGSEAGGERAFKRTLKRKNTATSDVSDKIAYNETIESNLCNEAMFILLECIENYLTALPLEQCSTPIFEKVSLFIVNILMNRQSFEFLESFFSFLRLFVDKFGALLLKDNSFLGEFCYQVMKYCNCGNDAIRYQASALLFLLMRKQYLCNSSQFHRITVQITISVSKLVGRGLSTDRYLKEALANVQEYARIDKLGGSDLETSIASLSDRLFTVLRDNMQIAKHVSDPEMMADLYHRLAHGYMNAPSLRITWLESLGNFYTQRKRYAESAMCMLHIAAMISEYLNIVDPKPGRPNGCVAFVPISMNILEETAIRETSAVSERDLSDSGTFTEEKLRSFLTQAISELKAGDLFETSCEVYKLLLSLFEKDNQYDLLSNAHSDLHQIYANIVECNSSQRRMLGSYYRVRFFGTAFEELDDTEFIYKEPKITKLVEIKERLDKLYSEKLKSDVKIIVHSNEVNVAELDPMVPHIQITSVEPYFDTDELKKRPTPFHQKVHINRFIFVSPFTKSGKARTESVADQYIRKTILTTERHFPYMRLRLRVQEKQKIELNPLEHTIEEIKKQSARIFAECNSQNPSLKTLQPVLSGSVCLQVQAGPLEYSRVFFLDRAADWQKEQLTILRTALMDFIDACRVGLDKHESMCESDHDLAFQASLENGFQDTKTKMDSHWETYLNKSR